VRGTGTQLAICLVHRPRYDDWTLPKGKCADGELDEDCALREVEEETGYACTLGEELATSSYIDSRGREKSVRYWAMEPARGSFSPNSEVDEIRWLPLEGAGALLSYERDRDLVARAAALLRSGRGGLGEQRERDTLA